VLQCCLLLHGLEWISVAGPYLLSAGMALMCHSHTPEAWHVPHHQACSPAALLHDSLLPEAPNHLMHLVLALHCLLLWQVQLQEALGA
jgi:hypothetical protein